GLPFELKAGPRSRGGRGGPFLDLPHVDLDVGAQLDASDLDPELRRDAVRSRSSGSPGRPEDLPRVCGPGGADLCIWVVHVVEAADLVALGHWPSPFRGARGGTTQTGQLAPWTTLRAVSRVNARRSSARACSPSTAKAGFTAARWAKIASAASP